jgi:phosphocarrier protein
MSTSVQDKVVITHDVGLHARPSVKLTKLAKGFPCKLEIAVREEGPWIDAKSIVKVMAMKAKQHETLLIRGEGEGAVEAVASLKGLVERDFDEDGAHAGGP